MSIRIMTAVWDRGPGTHTELLVLLAMADFADDEGYCWPSLPRIAEKARMSDRNARRIVRKLEADGFLETDPGKGRNNTSRYRVKPHGHEKPDNLSGVRKPDKSDSENRTNTTQNRTNGALKPDTAMSGEPSYNHQEPSIYESSTREDDLFSENEGEVSGLTPSQQMEKDFEEWWSAFPSRKGSNPKKTAFEKYKTARKRSDRETLLAAAKAYAVERQPEDPKFTVMAQTWLHQERWREYERPSAKGFDPSNPLANLPPHIEQVIRTCLSHEEAVAQAQHFWKSKGFKL